jgi:hypothetical protein
MPEPNQMTPDDSGAESRTYDRRYRRAFQGWVASQMRSRARQRRKADPPAPGPVDPGKGVQLLNTYSALSAVVRGRA